MEFFRYFDRNLDTKLGKNERKYFHFKVFYETFLAEISQCALCVLLTSFFKFLCYCNQCTTKQKCASKTFFNKKCENSILAVVFLDHYGKNSQFLSKKYELFFQLKKGEIIKCANKSYLLLVNHENQHFGRHLMYLNKGGVLYLVFQSQDAS